MSSDYTPSTAGSGLNGHASIIQAAPIAPVTAPPVQPEPISEGDGKKVKEPSQAQLMQRIIDCSTADGVPALQVFRTPTGTPYARCWFDGHYRNYPLSEKGGAVRKWLCFTFKEAHGYVPNSDTLARAIEGLHSTAEFDAPTYQVFTRIGYADGRIYLDMADEAWQTIEVSADGWRIMGEDEGLPVRFIRGAGMLPLPTPVRGGDLDSLQELLNVGDGATLMLLQGWLLGCLQPEGARAHLAIYGERGAAKTSAMRYLKNIIDPNIAIERGTPKEEDTIAIAARSNAVLTFDNFSTVADWLSDALCRLSTGAASGKRTLYTDDGETLTASKRPCVFTGIEEVVTRGDLLDRMIAIELQPITRRLTEADLNATFDKLHPALLGAVLDAASKALANLPNTYIEAERLPRLADFTLWVEAAAPALGWQPGAFIAAYAEVRAQSVDTELEADMVARAIMMLAGNIADAVDGPAEVWNDTATALDTKLKALLGIDDKNPPKGWPSNPQKLSGRVKRVAPAFRAKGIEVTYKRAHGANRVLIYRQ